MIFYRSLINSNKLSIILTNLKGRISSKMKPCPIGLMVPYTSYHISVSSVKITNTTRVRLEKIYFYHWSYFVELKKIYLDQKEFKRLRKKE